MPNQSMPFETKNQLQVDNDFVSFTDDHILDDLDQNNSRNNSAAIFDSEKLRSQYLINNPKPVLEKLCWDAYTPSADVIARKGNFKIFLFKNRNLQCS